MKWKEQVQHILRDLLFIGAGIQIVLGLIWLVCNLSATQLLPNASRLGAWENYYGFVYPALLWVLQKVAAPFEIPWYSLLYLIQLGFSFHAVFSFMRVFFPQKFLSVWFSLGVLTLPATMQVNLAVLPDSIVFSLYLMMIGIGIKAFRGEQRSRLQVLLLQGMLWILAAMLQPDYGLIGAAVLLIFLICGWRDKKNLKEYLAKAGMCLLLFCGTMGAVLVTEQMDSYELPHKSIGLRLVSRFAWPNIDLTRERWPAELYNHFDWKRMQRINSEADCIFTEFGPDCRELMGVESGERLFFRIARDAFMNRTGRITKDILWDGACYVFAPTMLYYQLRGVGYPSYSGRNYDFMRMHTPGLTKLYVTYTAFWFTIEILLAFVLMLVVRGKKLLPGKEVLFLLSNAVVLLGILVFRGAGVMDYKMGLFFPFLWVLFVGNVLNKRLLKNAID